MSIRKAIIPVAGLGTRFLPATKAIPKELLPLVDKPVLQYVVEEATASGIEEIIFVTSEHKTAIEQYFAPDANLEGVLQEKNKQQELASIQGLGDMARFTFVMQREPLGLGHAVLQAKAIIGDEPFVVLSGDDIVQSATPAVRQLMDVYNTHGASVIGVMKVPNDSVDRYGIIAIAEEVNESTWRISDIVEKPQIGKAPSQLAVGGRWLLTPDIFTYLERTQPGAGGEIQLTDAIHSLIQERPVYAKQYEGIYRDCGNKLEYVKAVIAFSLHHPEIKDGVKEYLSTL